VLFRSGYDSDTQPTGIDRPKRRWLLLIIALTAGLSMFITVSLLIIESQPPQTVSQAEPISVILQINDDTFPVNTYAQTVEAFIIEQNILIQAQDIVVPDRSSSIDPGMTIVIARARPVTVRIEDQEQIIRTSYESPFDILRLAAITVNPSDIVTIDGQLVAAADIIAWPLPVDTIDIQRTLPVTIIDGNNTLTLNTTSDTVADALFEADIELFLADTVIPALETPITSGLTITIDRSRPVTVIADNQVIETRVNTQTVGGALAELNISLNGLDYSIPAEDVIIQPGTHIRVYRVNEEIDTETELIPFDTVYEANNSMRLDTRAVVQAGQNGIYERQYRTRYENGIEISRELESEGLTQSPQNQVVQYGTNVVIRTLETPEGPVQYWRKMRMYATSYYPAELGGDNITSVGETLQKGIIAIDPRIVSYYTNMYVPGYGRGIAADTGGPRSTPYWVDLGYSDHDFIGWSQWVDVYLLTPVPDNITYLLPENERGGVIVE
jgi:resuscitation-promoting factor RpfB